MFGPHVQLLNPMGQPLAAATALASASAVADNRAIASPGSMQLPVLYLAQTDNAQNPEGSCNVTSIAMCLKYLGAKQNNPDRQLEDELQDWLAARGLDRHEPGA